MVAMFFIIFPVDFHPTSTLPPKNLDPQSDVYFLSFVFKVMLWIRYPETTHRLLLHNLQFDINAIILSVSITVFTILLFLLGTVVRSSLCGWLISSPTQVFHCVNIQPMICVSPEWKIELLPRFSCDRKCLKEPSWTDECSVSLTCII